MRAGDADAALVPWENSIGGAVGVTLDELVDGDPLVITRDVVIPVEFVLAARSGHHAGRGAVASPRIRRRPPSAGAGCGRTRRTRRWSTCCPTGPRRPAVAAGEFDAAICAPIAIQRFGLHRLADKIADHPDAVTRFVLLSRPGPPPQPTGDDITSLADLDLPRPGRRAAGGAHRAGRARGEPDPDRVPPHRRAARPLRLLPRLHRPRRRGAGRRGAAGPAPDLRRGALPRLVPAGAACPARRRSGRCRRRPDCPTRTTPTPPPGWAGCAAASWPDPCRSR